MPTDECSLPVTDLIIQRGVGVFESIRTYGNSVFSLTRHLERLKESARMCGIEADSILSELSGIIKEGVVKYNCEEKDLTIKTYITGGKINNCGHFPEPDYFIIFEEIHVIPKEDIERGVSLIPNRMERYHPEVKSINYLMGYLPMARARGGDFEALYFAGNEITESTASNFFLCLDGKIITAPVGRVLRGVTREVIITIAKENGYKIEERCPLEEELKCADEAFITGTIKEVLPVIRIGEQTIGTGHPGPVSQHLRALFAANKHRWMEKA